MPYKRPSNVDKNNHWYGRKHTEESKQKMRKPKSEEFKEKCRNRIFTEEHKANISKSRIGELNPNWGGDKLTFGGLHLRIRRMIKEPDNCDICKKQKPLDLANISGKYLLDIKDWQWLCRKCHMESDNRLNNLILSKNEYIKNRKIEISKRVCNICHQTNTTWYKDLGDGYICHTCNIAIICFRNRPIGFNKKLIHNRICNLCNSKESKYQWYYDINGFLCFDCYRDIRHIRKKFGFI